MTTATLEIRKGDIISVLTADNEVLFDATVKRVNEKSITVIDADDDKWYVQADKITRDENGNAQASSEFVWFAAFSKEVTQ